MNVVVADYTVNEFALRIRSKEKGVNAEGPEYYRVGLETRIALSVASPLRFDEGSFDGVAGRW
jgi:hypothetical protein